MTVRCRLYLSSGQVIESWQEIASPPPIVLILPGQGRFTYAGWHRGDRMPVYTADLPAEACATCTWDFTDVDQNEYEAFAQEMDLRRQRGDSP